jgi:predicted metal-dependent HD superfamily phosphohydrolase
MNLQEAFDKIGMPTIAQHLLKECYGQSHRHYHNLEHLEEMLKYVPDNYAEVQIVIEAILFHDFVHLSTPVAAGLNEALSIAEYLSYNAKALAVNIPFGKNNDSSFEYERRVIEAINSTARHTEDQQFLGMASKLVLDLDLSTFALPWEEYLVWKEKIEKENQEIWEPLFPAADIKRGRGAFLQKILERKQLFYLKIEWEDAARQNIQRDIELIGQLV